MEAQQLIEIKDLKESQDKRIIILGERNLSQQELNDLSKNTSIYLLTDGDIDNFIDSLPKVNIYYLNFSRYTLKWYDLNKNFFKNDITIYWRTIGYINKDNIEKLNVSHVREYLLSRDCDNMLEVYNNLDYKTSPEIMGCCSYCCNCLFSKITLAECCDYFGKCVKAAMMLA